MNMIFESPPGLWSLTAIIAVLILHRLRQRPERKEVSSLIIWQRIERLLTAAPVRKKSRLYLVLFLQILAVIALSLALARPVWRATRPEPLHLVFLIDNSASLSSVSSYYRDNDKVANPGTRWDFLMQNIRDMIAQSPADTAVSLYQTLPLKSFPNLRRAEASGVLDDMKQANIPSDLESLATQAQSVQGEFYFCSDKLPPEAFMDRFLRKPHLVLVGDPYGNMAIIRASATPASDPNSLDYYDVFVAVRNYSPLPADNVSLDLTNEQSINLGHQDFNLGAGQTKDLSFKNISLPDRPVLKIVLNNKDGMMADNLVSLAPNQPCQVRIAGKDNSALVKALKALPSVALNSPASAGDIFIFNETLPFSPSGTAIIINAASDSSVNHVFWDVQGRLENPLVSAIDTSSPILKYCDPAVFNHIPYAQKLLPKEKEYLPPLITARNASGDECLLMAEWRKADKHLVFLNFPLEWRGQANPTDWTLTPSFPIFWANLINYLHPISQDYTVSAGLCNEIESDNNGVTMLDTGLPKLGQMPRMETQRVELGLWSVILAGALFILGWLLAVRTK